MKKTPASAIKESADRIGKVYQALREATPPAPAAADKPAAVKKEIAPSDNSATLKPVREMRALCNAIFAKIKGLGLIRCGATFTSYNDEGWDDTDNYVHYVTSAPAKPPSGTQGSGTTLKAVEPVDRNYGGGGKANPKEGTPEHALQGLLDKVPQARELERRIGELLPAKAPSGSNVGILTVGDEQEHGTSYSQQSRGDRGYPDYDEYIYAEIQIEFNRKETIIILKSFDTGGYRDSGWKVWEKFDANFKPVARGATWPSDEKWKALCARHVAKYLGIEVGAIDPHKELPDQQLFKEE